LTNIRVNVPENLGFDFRPATEEEVHKRLSGLDPKKATGTDQLPPKLINMAADILAPSLTGLINKAIMSSTFPADLKKAEVLPIYKKKDRLDKGNYRPVSILPCISKVFEGVIADQLTNFFNSVFSPFLAAFRRGYSCNSVLLKLVEDWRLALDNHLHVGAVLMDLSKAFDCLPHNLLLAKLKAYGLSESSLNYLKSYLTGRKQRVKISQSFSQWDNTLKGVPQGSILGPLLFNVFINDIFYALKECDLYNYADDNTLSYAHKEISSVITTLESESEVAIDWFSSNLMLANPDKFQAIILGPNSGNEPHTFNFGETQVQSEESVKLLGVDLDNKLNFHSHVSNLCLKTARQINALKRLARFLDFEGRLAIYRSFIISNFNYCPTVWHFCGEAATGKLERLNERALRFVYDDKNSTYQQLLVKLGTPSLHLGRLRLLATEVYKVTRKIGPPLMDDLFSPQNSTYNFRKSNSLPQPRFNTKTYGYNSLRYYGTKIWNEMPNHIRTATSLKHFRTLINTWMGLKCKCSMCNAFRQFTGD
jgi:hypothetical protein